VSSILRILDLVTGVVCLNCLKMRVFSYLLHGLALTGVLFLGGGLIGLHADRNNESSEGVTTHNSTIVHDILGCDFTARNW